MLVVRVGLIAFGLVLASSTAAAAPGELPFHCTVKNVAMLKVGATPKQICEEMKAGAERSMRIKMKPLLQFGPMDRARSSWLKIDVTLHSSGEAIAQVSQRTARRQRSFPPIAVSVSDKRLGMQSIKHLAHEVGNALAR